MSEGTVTPRRTQGGWMQVDLAVGVVVIAIGIVSIVNLCAKTARLRALDAEVLLAFTAAKGVLEEARALPFADVPALDGRGFAVADRLGGNAGLLPVPGDGDALPGVLTVTTQAQSGTERLYHLKAAVTWVGVLGRQTLDLETWIADRHSR